MTNSTKIVGIFGQKENGKTTVRRYITTQLLRSHIIFPRAFATPVKELVEVLTGHNAEYLDSIKEKILPGFQCTVRECYQKISTFIRSVCPVMLVEQALYAEPSTPNLIIDDGRFKEEVDEIHRRGGKCLLIIRPDKLNDDSHETESWVGSVARHHYRLRIKHKTANVSNFDYIVFNDGSLDQLYQSINAILPELSNFYTSIK